MNYSDKARRQEGWDITFQWDINLHHFSDLNQKTKIERQEELRCSFKKIILEKTAN